MAESLRRKRRFLQFSLRSFLILLTAACIWLGVQSQSVRRQRQVVGLVERLGGSIAYDYQYDEDPFSTAVAKAPPGPALLRRIVGDDFFARLTKVQLDQAQDREVRRIADQTTIKHLVVSGMLTDQGIESISRLINLETLEIYGGKFSGAGLANLSKLTKLRSLTIGNAAVTDEAAASIGTLTNLESLSVRNSRMGSKQLRHFKRLQKLSSLDLSGTLVGDKGLDVLLDLKRLTSVRLDRSMVTAKGVNRLREALPHVQITPIVVGQELY